MATRSILSPAEYQERVDTILALLEERPYTIGQLGALMTLHRGAVAAALRSLARQQLVHRGDDEKWRLGANLRRTGAAPTADDLEEAVEDFEADETVDPITADEPELLETVRAAGRPALRQPKAANRAHVEVAPSWWTQAPPQGFSQRAAAEHKRMRWTKEAHQVPMRILQ